MATITRLEAENFKSFENVKVDLHPFNVVIGANASGKSNFVEVLRFVRDIAQHGLDNAVGMQGGVPYLRNMRLASAQPLCVRLVVAFEPGEEGTYLPPLPGSYKRWTYWQASETELDFALQFNARGEGFRVVADNIRTKFEVFEIDLPRVQLSLDKMESLGTSRISVSKTAGKIKITSDLPRGEASSKQFLERLWQPRRRPRQRLIVEGPTSSSPLVSVWNKVLGSISLYDFDPKLPKKAVAITGKMELEEDGGNLAIVLKNILGSSEKKRKFSNLLKDVLPFINDVGIETLADRSLFFKVREAYSASKYLPASLLSDGTINISALIAALFFERKPIIIIEEPERNMHPHLASRVVDMLNEASKHKQIIITTHNPEVVKHVGLDNLLLVARNNDGYSEVTKPGELGMIKTFLRNEIGIDELFVQNLLGV